MLAKQAARRPVSGLPEVRRCTPPIAVGDALLPENVHALLDPATHAVETGYCELPDGTAYVASLVPLPGCTAEMYGWWFWWHGVESARYPLWYPYNHVSVGPLDRELLWRPRARHERFGGRHRGPGVRARGPVRPRVSSP
jgi:hypothetical protein